jgi:hypothetical protein
MFRGSCAEILRPTPTKMTRITYAKFPPKILFVRENANNQSAVVGPTICWIDATVCARPCVAPSDRLLGAAEEMYMYAAADAFVSDLR